MTAETWRDAGPDEWRLDHRVALVTGAESGIGRGVALALADAGAVVVRDDGADPAAIDEVVRGVARDHGRLDILCNLAGEAVPGRLVDLDEASFDESFAGHFKATLFACRAALEVMKPAGRGVIINLSSAAIDTAPAGAGAFAVSTASISMLTRILAAEAGRSGVRVNAIAPGLGVQSARAADADAWAAIAATERGGAPLAEVTVDDVAAQALYLATDAGRFVTGQTLRVNGGSAMTW